MRIRLAIWVLLIAGFVVSCVPRPPRPPIPPQPPAQQGRLANVTILNVEGQQIPVHGVFTVDTVPDLPLTSDGTGRLSFSVPSSVPFCNGGSLVVNSPGYKRLETRALTPESDEEWPWGRLGDCPFVPDGPNAVLVMERAAPLMFRLHMDGRQGLRNPQDIEVGWKGLTGFRLNEFVAHGNPGAAVHYFSGIKPAKFARVLMMAFNLFKLTPSEGVAALPSLLDIAQQQDTYLEVTVFADTASYPGIDYRGISRQVGQICATHVACAAVEIGNELSPLHPTQDDKLGDVNFLKELRNIVREAGPIPVSLGSTHADQDESDIFRDGDYLTIHGARGGGDYNDWRWVRHMNEIRALGDKVGRYPVNDEPRRDDLACDKQLGAALMARINHFGDTFHYAGGLQGLPPEGNELSAFNCRVRGWSMLPDDWWGIYFNAGFVGSPVKDFSGAVRIYSSVRGSEAWTLVLGAESGLRIGWNAEWPNRNQVLSEGEVQLWHVTR